MIKRIFHPIGQGAFYSERHQNCNIVYDCGNWKNSKLADKVVKQSFKKDEEIDILFISHFDFDHVSKIPILKNHVKRIKKVVMPLLHDNEKNLLSNLYRVLGFNILTLINEPEKFFGDETDIVYIIASDNKEGPIIEFDSTILNIYDIKPQDSSGKREINSGVKITLNSQKDWVFIPFNYNYANRHADLLSKLEHEGFDIEKLKNNPNYTLDKIAKDISLPKSKAGKILQQIYDKLDGKINQNSMYLYSGPINNGIKYKSLYYGGCDIFCHVRYFFNHYDLRKIGCIYTGDGDLNVVDIKAIFKNYWHNVGTIQISHHGDVKSFSSGILKNGYYCCPISVGKNNSYGHPSSSVIGEILSHRSIPMLITEDLNSIYIEVIES